VMDEVVSLTGSLGSPQEWPAHPAAVLDEQGRPPQDDEAAELTARVFVVPVAPPACMRPYTDKQSSVRSQREQ
jgi:hypothetical protein